MTLFHASWMSHCMCNIYIIHFSKNLCDTAVGHLAWPWSFHQWRSKLFETKFLITLQSDWSIWFQTVWMLTGENSKFKLDIIHCCHQLQVEGIVLWSVYPCRHMLYWAKLWNKIQQCLTTIVCMTVFRNKRSSVAKKHSSPVMPR